MKHRRVPSRAPRLPVAARVGAVLWPSFFAAGVATMVFFAVVDPLELGHITWPMLHLGRELGYTLGFFMFWACTLGSSLFTSLLLTPRNDHSPENDEDA